MARQGAAGQGAARQGKELNYMDQSMTHITRPCLVLTDGVTYTHPEAWSHAALLRLAMVDGFDVTRCEHAFLDDEGNVLTRFIAQRVARKAGQLHQGDSLSPFGLQSHHLWAEDGTRLWEVTA